MRAKRLYCNNQERYNIAFRLTALKGCDTSVQWLPPGGHCHIDLMGLLPKINTHSQICYREISYTSSKVPAQLHGYTLAFVTDLHGQAAEVIQQIAHNIDQRRVNLLLLGGDFQRGRAMLRALDLLGQVLTQNGIYGVEGNHDNYRKLFSAMQARGITPLDNSGTLLQPGFYLAGVADMWRRKADIAAALQNAPENAFRLLVSHNPDVCLKQDTSQVDLMLSGHTHDGQISFWGLWTPAHLWLKFKAGWSKTPHGADLFVSAGAGQLKGTPRFYVPPEVIYLTLKTEKAGSK